jgi:UDP-N-acetylmuramate dehydrogenase
MENSWKVISNHINRELSREASICNYEIGLQTTYRTIGRCSIFAKVETVTELDHVMNISRSKDMPVAFIGNGSNLLIADEGFEGLMIKLGSGFESVEFSEDRVHVGGAAKLPVVARLTSSKGLAGFEWAVGVPGTIGGAVKMNAGGHGSDMSLSIESVDLVDTKTGVTKSLALNDLSFGYRQSAVSENQLVTKAILRLSEGDADESLTMIKEIVRWRIENQPGGQNAGSVFTNPKENSAGRLIDESGCKGLRVGSAEISRKHANFIQVDTGGKAQDVKDLMNLIQERVYSKFGVYLKEETQMIGFS